MALRSVVEILQFALDSADRERLRGTRIEHLEQRDKDHLAEQTLKYLRSRPSVPSSQPGWTILSHVDAAVNRWWNEQLGVPYPSPDSRRLRPLRKDIYDYLDELGHIIKEPGNTSPIHIGPPRSSEAAFGESRPVTVSGGSAFFGDPETNKRVELAAMDAVINYMAGWTATDVSADKCGWDITFTRGNEVVHAEVKGVSGADPIILLTRNEYAVSQQDSAWRLYVVTLALIAPTVQEFRPEDVARNASPFVYRVDLA